MILNVKSTLILNNDPEYLKTANITTWVIITGVYIYMALDICILTKKIDLIQREILLNDGFSYRAYYLFIESFLST